MKLHATIAAALVFLSPTAPQNDWPEGIPRHCAQSIHHLAVCWNSADLEQQRRLLAFLDAELQLPPDHTHAGVPPMPDPEPDPDPGYEPPEWMTPEQRAVYDELTDDELERFHQEDRETQERYLNERLEDAEPGPDPDPDPEPEPDPDPLPPGEPGEPRTSVTSNGITWTFDRPTEVGQFVTDDWWAVGPVVVVEISPACTVEGGRVRNGSMIDPQVGWHRDGGPGDGYPHGFDSATRDGAWYQAQLNVALRLPVTLEAPCTLVSSRSLATGQSRPQLTDVAVLTVLAAPPPADAFRPAPYANPKGIPATLADVRWDLIPSLELPAPLPLLPIAGSSVPDRWVSAARAMERIWFHPAPDPAARPFHPANHMPVYGSEIAATGGAAALALASDQLTLQDRERLAIGLIQAGIDMHGVTRAQGFRADHWLVGGGHASGIVGLILLAGLLLDDDSMLAIRQDRPGMHFNETGQTFYLANRTPDWCSQYIRGTQPCPLAWDDPSQANKYRTCCTASSWWGWAAALESYGLAPNLAHPAFFDYQERYHQEQVVNRPNAGGQTHYGAVPWNLQAWLALR